MKSFGNLETFFMNFIEDKCKQGNYVRPYFLFNINSNYEYEFIIVEDFWTFY